MERSDCMNGRKRKIQIKFYVTEEERALIEQKMKLVPTRNMAAYLRKIAIDGYIIQTDHSDIKAMTAEIQKIGVLTCLSTNGIRLSSASTARKTTASWLRRVWPHSTLPNWEAFLPNCWFSQTKTTGYWNRRTVFCGNALSSTGLIAGWNHRNKSRISGHPKKKIFSIPLNFKRF